MFIFKNIASILSQKFIIFFTASLGTKNVLHQGFFRCTNESSLVVTTVDSKHDARFHLLPDQQFFDQLFFLFTADLIIIHRFGVADVLFGGNLSVFRGAPGIYLGVSSRESLY